MTNGLKAVLLGVGVGLAIVGVMTLAGERTRRRLKKTERVLDDDARSRMDAEGGAMQPVPTHIH